MGLEVENQISMDSTSDMGDIKTAVQLMHTSEGLPHVISGTLRTGTAHAHAIINGRGQHQSLG